MKNKTLIAIEKESSQTTRYTVKDYADLFQLIPTREIKQFFDIVNRDLAMFGDDARHAELSKYLIKQEPARN